MRRRTVRKPSLLVLGDITIDILARIEAFAGLGQDCLSPELELHCGGVGANTAIALAKWGLSVRLMGSVGRDCFGDLALRFLRAERIDVSRVRRDEDATTGLMFIAVRADGQRTIFGSRGANAELAPLARRGGLGGIEGTHLVGYSFLSTSGAEAAEQLLEKSRQRGSWISLDVGMAPSREIPQKILQLAGKVDILFANSDEAIALTGRPDQFEAFGALEEAGAREVVMKRGSRGCLFSENGRLQEAPSFAVAATDTTGAGDAFVAAFLRARLRDWPKAEAALLGNAAGAAAASVVGAGEAMPSPRQILRLLRHGRMDDPWDKVRLSALARLRKELGV
jgi:ribokinase